MANAVAAAIRDNAVLVAEAGTGTGKTFAYLVPALLSGGKVIISTGTKTLQDQLFNRDIPIVRDALKVPVTVALLKGRANYVCHHYLERAQHEGRFQNRDDARYLRASSSFAKNSAPATEATCRTCRRTRPIWPHVTSTRENCLGSRVRALREVLRHGSAQAGAGGRCRGGQSSPVFRRRRAARRRRGRTAAGVATPSSSTRRTSCRRRPGCFSGRRCRPQPVDRTRARQRGSRPRSRRETTPALPEAARASRRRRATCVSFSRKNRDVFRIRRWTAYASSRRRWRPSMTKLGALAAALESQAERAEGLEKCWQRSARSARSAARLARRRRSVARALGRVVLFDAESECDAAVGRRDFSGADRRACAGLDFHLGDIIGWRRFRSLLRGRWG